MSLLEIRKIYNFIIKNNLHQSIEVFPNETIRKIEEILSNKNNNEDFDLTEEQKKLIIESFKSSKVPFDSSTPNIIKEDLECIVLSISIDLDSLSFLDYFYQVTTDLKNIISDLAKKQNYVLNENSSSILRRNFEVALNSIKLDIRSADYVEYEYLWPKESNTLIEMLSKSNYSLSESTPEFLLNSEAICLTSLKNDFTSVKYIPSEIKAKCKVFKYLLENGYEFTEEELECPSISILQDEEILNFFQNKIQGIYLFNYNHNQREDQFKMYRNLGLYKAQHLALEKLLTSFLKSKPTISEFTKIWESRAIDEWNRYRFAHPENYANLFVKITEELKAIKDFEDIFKDISFTDIYLTIPEEYETLIRAMKEYHSIYQNRETDYLEKLQKPALVISKCIALYLAASKESFIKDELSFYKHLAKPYFKVRKEHPLINKKIIEQRKRKIYEYLYINSDPSVEEFTENLIEKYKERLPEEQLKVIITSIIRGFKFIDLLADAPKKPKNYEKYILLKKVKKIVVRLNAGYLKKDSKEVEKYKEFIIWDDNKNKYLVSPNIINPKAIASCKRYEDFLKIYNELRILIANEIRKIEYDGVVKKEVLDNLSEHLPFTDEFFEFDSEKIKLKNLIVPKQIIESKPTDFSYSYDFVYEFSPIYFLLNTHFYDSEILKNKRYTEILHKLLVESGIGWLLFIEQDSSKNIPSIYKNKVINSRETLGLLNGIPTIIAFASMINYNLESTLDFIRINNISNYIDISSLAILGPDLSLGLRENNNYSIEEMSDIIKKACYLISKMSQRKASTVPYVSGNTDNYHYSTYSFNDNDLLLAGINTSSCFKINNTDNDFLFYTALDKNGFAIRITDKSGNFIGRACGFRNGNFIYLNQLRTIYDKGNNELAKTSKKESVEIIEALKKACQDMIDISKNNQDDSLGIDAVFITQSYILKEYQAPVINKELISVYPMDNRSEDWHSFVKNTSYLRECELKGNFTTDYASYPVICIASSKPLEQISIINHDNDAIYCQPRKDIICSSIRDRKVVELINRISSIRAYIDCCEFEPTNIKENYKIYLGEDWYILEANGEVIESCIISENTIAQKEFNDTIKLINENKKPITDEEEETTKPTTSPKTYTKRKK